MNTRLFLTLQHIAPQHALSRIVGSIANCRLGFVKNTFIGWFAKRYNVNMAEALHSDPLDYPSFNEFFTRELKPCARVVDEAEAAIACPADGAISQIGLIEHGSLLQAKGYDFSLVNLLGGKTELAEPFQDGSFATVYLSPRDYHRIHMPITGTLKRMVHVPGKLFSVNQVTSENVPELFSRNERVVCFFETEHGPMALVLVGAMIVASIDTVWGGQVCPGRTACADVAYDNHVPPIQILKGEEMGRFKLGSTVIAVFGAGMVTLAESLGAGDAVQMGQCIGTLNAVVAASCQPAEI